LGNDAAAPATAAEAKKKSARASMGRSEARPAAGSTPDPHGRRGSISLAGLVGAGVLCTKIMFFGTIVLGRTVET
jgi:hypothetical protein